MLRRKEKEQGKKNEETLRWVVRSMKQVGLTVKVRYDKNVEEMRWRKNILGQENS